MKGVIMNIGEHIFTIRKERHLSQEDLGELVGVTRHTISNWELNVTSPDTTQLIELSKALNISIDDLVNHDIKNVIVEHVSNTEALAGMIIKIIKFFIYCFFAFAAFIVLMIVIVIIMGIYPHQKENSNGKSVELNCSIKNNKYVITIGSDSYFNCPNCDKQMQVYLKDITGFANIETSVKNVQKYFTDNGGTCSEE